jgi:hypothetical protein
MNSRASDRQDSTLGRRRLLRCGISIRPMTASGHKQTFGEVCSMSGLPPKADIDRRAARWRVAAVGALCY